MTNNKNGFVISIGEFCLISSVLQNTDMKKNSFPFDWLFSNPKFVKECMKTNFEPLLDMIIRQEKDYYIHYNDVEFKQVGMPHKDKTDIETLQYYKRTIDRFYKASRSHDKKIFLHVNGVPKNSTNFNYLNDISMVLNDLGIINYKIITIKITNTNTNTNPNTNSNEKIKYQKTYEVGDIMEYTISIGNEITIANWMERINEYKYLIKNILCVNGITEIIQL